MEYIGKTSLYQYLKSKPKKRISEQETKKIFRRIIMGVQYLHCKKIAHRDIKLDNIMVNENYDVKIIDFGFSLFTQPGKKLNLHCGTPSYMAPELVAKKDYLGQPVDVWALGVLLYKMLTGYYPFNGKSPLIQLNPKVKPTRNSSMLSEEASSACPSTSPTPPRRSSSGCSSTSQRSAPLPNR